MTEMAKTGGLINGSTHRLGHVVPEFHRAHLQLKNGAVIACGKNAVQTGAAMRRAGPSFSSSANCRPHQGIGGKEALVHRTHIDVPAFALRRFHSRQISDGRLPGLDVG